METADTGKRKFWNFIDNFKGDKVIWMIVLLLILLSLVSVFSSASGLVKGETSRFDILFEQFRIICIGLALIIGIYNIPNIRIIKFFSSFGFVVSLALLICLVAGIGAIEVNGAVRSLKVGGMQIYVFEVIKVAMVVYLAWAVHTYKNGSFWTKWLADKYPKLAFLEKDWAKRVVHIYAPILIVCVGMFKGGISSTLFCGLIMFLTILIGGMPKREIFGAVAVGCVFIAIFVGMYVASDGKYFSRIGVAIDRLTMHKEYEIIQEGNVRSDEYRAAMDRIRQPEGAKIAVKEGGLIGKGPGGSTQKYSVYAIFSDYMYSFIIEEFGLVMGIFVLILYVSLLARGALIVKFCDSCFAKTAVAGLVLLISGQAFMHMFINVNIGPLTGQTLPMVSHGDSSFLSFSMAFGVLLSISKLAKQKTDAAIAEMNAEKEAAEEGAGSSAALGTTIGEENDDDEK